jgi:hypothetical protein
LPGRLRLAAALAAIVLIPACEPPVEPILDQERRILVHGILDLSADTQRVMLEWTRTSTSPSSVGILGATVRITSPQGQTANLAIRPPNATPAPFDPARYIFLVSETFGALQRGGTYQLNVDVPGQPTITGSTTIPDTNPTNSVTVRTLPFSIANDTLRMTWRPVRGAAGYRVMVSGQHPTQPAFLTTKGVFTDTAAVLPGTMQNIEGSDFFIPGYIAHVTALAVDDNYLTYYRAPADPFSGAPPTRLTGGAIGLFGSVVPIQRQRFTAQ